MTHCDVTFRDICTVKIRMVKITICISMYVVQAWLGKTIRQVYSSCLPRVVHNVHLPITHLSPTNEISHTKSKSTMFASTPALLLLALSYCMQTKCNLYHLPHAHVLRFGNASRHFPEKHQGGASSRLRMPHPGRPLSRPSGSPAVLQLPRRISAVVRMPALIGLQ
jgi:hypothetical protein